MTTTNYCKIKGPSYPESSIWRFKEENRALMRRLYGDMESTSVYREMRATTSSYYNSHHRHHHGAAAVHASAAAADSSRV